MRVSNPASTHQQEKVLGPPSMAAALAHAAHPSRFLPARPLNSDLWPLTSWAGSPLPRTHCWGLWYLLYLVLVTSTPNNISHSRQPPSSASTSPPLSPPPSLSSSDLFSPSSFLPSSFSHPPFPILLRILSRSSRRVGIVPFILHSIGAWVVVASSLYLSIYHLSHNRNRTHQHCYSARPDPTPRNSRAILPSTKLSSQTRTRRNRPIPIPPLPLLWFPRSPDVCDDDYELPQLHTRLPQTPSASFPRS